METRLIVYVLLASSGDTPQSIILWCSDRQGFEKESNSTPKAASERDIEVEHHQGSALDHSHCVTCISRSCRVTGNSLTSCEVIQCPRGCDSRYHACKENEHVLLCPEERVSCFNSLYGCPAVLHRKRMAEHLTSCPASIVHCRAEWNRLHLQPGGAKSTQAVVMKKIYEDCGQLDMALAMRDHRVLVDRHLFPQQTSAKSPGALVQLRPTALTGPWSSSSSDVHEPMDLPDRWDSDFSQLKKKPVLATSSLTAESVASSMSNCLPDQVDSMTEGRAVSFRKDNSMEGGLLGDGQPSCQLFDGQALQSILSVNMSVECMARCQPKPGNTYTFLCAQDVRRDEFPHHFYAVHDCIQSGLSGWMEQRCPLAYLGCPFSFRRLRPSAKGMTVCHSWLLESFGLTSVGPQADYSHQTPPHLLPAFAETADSWDVAMNDQLLERAESRNQVSYMPSCSGGLRDSRTAGDSFSFQGNNLSQKEESRGQALNSEDSLQETSVGDVSHRVNLSGQVSQHLQPSENAYQKTSVQNQHDQETGKTSCLSPSDPSVPCISDGLFRISKPQSFTSLTSGSTPVRGKPVIYSGLGPDSCVRIDIQNSNNDREAGEGLSSLQLEEMPREILRHITYFLDSFSLYNLSLVSHAMRDLCCTLLQERGMVSLVWAKQQMGDKVIWRIIGKRWSYSTSFDPVESWSFTGHNPIPDHLRTCPYNQDRLQHTEKFSIMPDCETPLNIQIRDMLQELLQRRRFVGRPRWYIAAMKKYFKGLCDNPDTSPS